MHARERNEWEIDKATVWELLHLRVTFMVITLKILKKNYNRKHKPKLNMRFKAIFYTYVKSRESSKVMTILRYPWGPNTMNCRLCVNCWKYWKKYGGLMLPASTRKNILVNRGDGKVLFFKVLSSFKNTVNCWKSF